jgi:hypothetical protein
MKAISQWNDDEISRRHDPDESPQLAGAIAGGNAVAIGRVIGSVYVHREGRPIQVGLQQLGSTLTPADADFVRLETDRGSRHSGWVHAQDEGSAAHFLSSSPGSHRHCMIRS